MLAFSSVAGAIFDVDETLLDTGIADPVNGLHAQARLQATREAGQRHNLPELLGLTPEQNYQAFLEAPVHTLENAVWQTLYMLGVESTAAIDPQSPLLLEITARKNILYEKLLRTQGKPVPGAIQFVQALAAQGLQDKLAIASSAIRRDIDIFLEFSGLQPLFPKSHIIARDNGGSTYEIVTY